MSPEALQQWLEAHIYDIHAFMDYEATIDSEEELMTTLGYWFGHDAWREAGFRFVHLGIDGEGSHFAAWIRPGVEGPAPVVYFGSEGGRGVLARSPRDWAMVLAHAPSIDEYPRGGDDLPARLHSGPSWKLEDDASEEAKGSLAQYRAAVVERFGDVAEFGELAGGLDELNEAFCRWADGGTPV